jgi:hypothetical protein
MADYREQQRELTAFLVGKPEDEDIVLQLELWEQAQRIGCKFDRGDHRLLCERLHRTAFVTYTEQVQAEAGSPDSSDLAHFRGRITKVAEGFGLADPKIEDAEICRCIQEGWAKFDKSVRTTDIAIPGLKNGSVERTTQKASANPDAPLHERSKAAISAWRRVLRRVASLLSSLW